MWHASVAVYPPLLASEWGPERKLEALGVCRRMLRGVGLEDIVEQNHPHAIAVHVRRKVRPSELAVVGPATDVRR